MPRAACGGALMAASRLVPAAHTSKDKHDVKTARGEKDDEDDAYGDESGEENGTQSAASQQLPPEGQTGEGQEEAPVENQGLLRNQLGWMKEKFDRLRGKAKEARIYQHSQKLRARVQCVSALALLRLDMSFGAPLFNPLRRSPRSPRKRSGSPGRRRSSLGTSTRAASSRTRGKTTRTPARAPQSRARCSRPCSRTRRWTCSSLSTSGSWRRCEIGPKSAITMSEFDFSNVAPCSLGQSLIDSPQRARLLAPPQILAGLPEKGSRSAVADAMDLEMSLLEEVLFAFEECQALRRCGFLIQAFSVNCWWWCAHC